MTGTAGEGFGAGAGRITLWGIEVFVATAEEGAISSAARRLGTSAATVSQQLTNLEGALGAQLLDRGARPVTLTPAGTMFLARANAILNEADQARAELAMADLSRLTRFRLGMIEDFDADVTPRLLSALAEELRHCQFLLETGASHRLFAGLEDRGLDVIVAADMGRPADGMEVHPLLEEPFVLACPAGLSPQAALALPMVQYTTRHHMGRVIAAHLMRQNLAVTSRFELDSYNAILALVAGGAGWTILTPLGWRLAERFRGQVTLHPLPWPPLSRMISLTARRGVLGDLPEIMAGHLRRLAKELVVAPAVAEMPWLAGALRLA